MKKKVENTMKKTSVGSAFVGMSLLVSPLSFAAQGQIEEVLITAQKREQSITDVPISVTAISGDQIAKGNIESLVDLSAKMPSITIAEAGAGDQIFVRGIGSGINSGFEQSVGTFIDGIYFGRGRQSIGQFLDIQTLELLRGPQSTYFGNNTIGGAINITTKRPTDEWEGYVNTLYEFEHNEKDVQGAIGGPITDKLGVRLAGRYREIDGWLDNTQQGSDTSQKESHAVRASLVYDFSENLQVFAKIEHAQLEEIGNNFQIIYCPAIDGFANGNTCTAHLATAGFEDRLDDVKQDGPVPSNIAPNSIFEQEDHELETLNGLVQLDWYLGENKFTSVTGYTFYDDDRGNIDVDFGPAPLIMSPQTDKYEQISQEFRFASPEGNTLEYMTGVYFQHSNLKVFNSFAVAAFNGMGINDHHQDEESISAFGTLTWNISDRLSASLGLRWTEVEKEIDRNFTVISLDGSPATPLTDTLFANFLGFVSHPNPLQFEREDSDTIPSLGIQWDVLEDLMLYATYTEGFKAGGFDSHTRSAADAANFAQFERAINFDSETVKSVEVGMKGYFFDKSLRAGVAVFRSEYEDLQVSTFDGAGGFLTGNAGESRTQGVEVELLWAVSENLELNLAYAYLDAEYTEFESAQCRLINPRPNAAQPGSCIQTGEELLFSPEYSGNLGMDYYLPLMNGEYGLALGVDFIFSDDYFYAADNDPYMVQEAYEKVDASITFAPASGKWEISVVGQNLTDEYTVTQGNDLPVSPGSYFVNLERTRSIALQGRLNF